MSKAGAGNRLFVLLLAAAAGAILYRFWHFAGFIGSDFKVFHDSAVRFLADPARLYHRLPESDALADIATLQGWLYAPPAILPFLPLALGSREAAFAIFSPLSILAAVAACWLWARSLARELPQIGAMAIAACAALAMATSPVFHNQTGQIDTLVLPLCVAAVLAGARGHAGPSGALIAAGGWIKIYPAILIVLPLFRGRHPKAAMAFLATGIAIPLASLAIVPAQLFRNYFADYLPVMSGRTIGNIYNQSLSAIWLRATHPEIDWTRSFAAFDVPWLFGAASFAGAAGAAFAIHSRARGSTCGSLLVASAVMALIPLVAPLGWGHSYAFALPLLITVAMFASATRSATGAAATGLAWLLFAVPAYTVIPAGGPVGQFFYARYAIATAILLTALWGLSANPALKRVGERPI